MQLSVKQKMVLLTGGVLAGFIVTVLYGFYVLSDVKINGKRYHQIVQDKDVIADILPPPAYLVGEHQLALEMLVETRREKLVELSDRSRKFQEEFEARYRFWEKDLDEGDLYRDSFLKGAYGPAKEYLSVMNNEFIPAIMSGGSKEAALRIYHEKLVPLFDRHDEKVDETLKTANDDLAAIETNTAADIRMKILHLTLLVLAVLVGSIIFSVLILRSILRPLDTLVQRADRIAAGDLSQEAIVVKDHDEIGTLLEKFNAMSETLRRLIKEATQLTKAAAAGDFAVRGNASAFSGGFAEIVKGNNETLDTVVGKMHWYEQLLDCIPFPISVTDMGMNWTFINKAAESRAKVNRAEALGKKCKNMKNGVCGTPNCAMIKLNKGESKTFFQTVEGGHFQVDSAFLSDRKGKRIGHIEMLQDISEKVLAEQAKEREVKEKESVAAYQNAEVQKLAESLKKLGQGSLEFETKAGEGSELTKKEREQFEKIYQGLDEAKNAIGTLIADMGKLSRAAIDGRLKARGNVSKFQGGYRDIIKGVNDTLDAMLKPVEEASVVLERMAENDFTVAMVGDYKNDLAKIKTNVNKVLDLLNGSLSKVSEATVQIATASQQLSSTAEEMSAGAAQQTNQTAQVATSMEEMSATVQQVAKNSSLAAQKANDAGTVAKQGGDVVAQTVQEMGKIADSVRALQGVIDQLSRNSEKIGDIIGVIDDVADQTNLLALNAAIEAARAGEQGRGFAVVADEVRKLAERTTQSTKEIATMIKTIQGDTAKASSAMEQSASEVEHGVVYANTAGSSLKEIVENSRAVTDMVKQIATAAEQQSAASEEISANIESIASVSKQTSSGAQQTSSAAEELSSLTEGLQSMIGRFRLRQGGDRPA